MTTIDIPVLLVVLPALILASGLVWAAYVSQAKHIKPRKSFAQVAIIGRTEEGETVQLTVTLFDDETPGVWDQKLNTAYELREKRLKFQNERMLALHAEHRDSIAAKEALVKEAEAKN